MSASPREIVEKVNAGFAENKPEVFLSHCADDVVWRMVGDKFVRGKDGIREFMKSMPIDEPPQFTVDSLMADGDNALSKGEMTMKDESGKVGRYSYCDVYSFSDGKIAELTSYVIKTEGESEFERGKTAT